MEDFPDVDAYLEASDQWPAEIEVLRALLLDCGLTEKIKWGKPCYCLDDANIVVIQEFMDHLALMFFKGVLLEDPEEVLHDQGPNSHAAKRIKFTSIEEVEALSGVVTAYVRGAACTGRGGTGTRTRGPTRLR
jgi:uncharacterized protein YdeI (YjbR/CyaY-like superfamily)